MKIPPTRICSFQRPQLLMFHRKTNNNSTVISSSVTLGNNNVKRRCYPSPSSSILKELFSKLKNKLKLALGWKRNNNNGTTNYTYDLHSYWLNFDDGPPSIHHVPIKVC
ncbi:hypothetical protein PIB30_033112 [Stylosanthes scabra]|uniref:Uncharacterized protein n=1 Tax=Stylosanthes scabra TaxID=79078 RepID=A0ABU6TEA5_9FABA|nr:hypothetical protein [Stylosanthes scabra]